SSRLTETLPFACALMPRLARADAISDLAALDNDRILSIAFLETKAYDHPIWLDFVASFQQRLLASAETELDPDWLAQAHLFTVISNDADRAAKLGHGVGTKAAIHTFFEGLAERGSEIILRLIEAYAHQDVAVAFRVAELMQLDILTQLPS